MLSHRREGAVEIGLGGHAKRRFVQQRRAELAAARFFRARALAGGQRPGDHRGDEKKREREDLVGVRDDQLVCRRHEEPVERQERKDARRDGRCAPVRDGDEQHRDEVQHREIRDG